MPLVPKAIKQLKPYTPGRPIAEVQRELGLDRVVKLASNENPWGPSPRALAAIGAAAEGLHRYPDMMARDLREAQDTVVSAVYDTIRKINRKTQQLGDELLG